MADARARGAVFLLTDYGTADEFAGVLRAVLARLAPGAPLVDLTHEIQPFDVRAGALALCRAAPHLGPGVVLAVVDPGVGTNRRAVAVGLQQDHAHEDPVALVGPDNGLLPWLAELLGGARAAVVLPPAGGGAATFDGRDVFAPAAAALWRGVPLVELGEPIEPGDLVRLAEPRRVAGPGTIETEVLWVDRFGNVQLSATPEDAVTAGLTDAAQLHVEVVATGAITVVDTVLAFAELAGASRPGLLTDANGHLAVVCDRAPAATVLAVQAGDAVTVRAVTGQGE